MAYDLVIPVDASTDTNGKLTIQVVYVDQVGGRKKEIPLPIPQGVVLDIPYIRTLAIDEATRLNAGATTEEFIKSILNQPIDLTPIKKPDPTADDLAITAFDAAMLLLRTLEKKVTLGLATADDVTAQITAIGKLYDAGTPEQQVFFDNTIRMV